MFILKMYILYGHIHTYIIEYHINISNTKFRTAFIQHFRPLTLHLDSSYTWIDSSTVFYPSPLYLHASSPSKITEDSVCSRLSTREYNRVFFGFFFLILYSSFCRLIQEPEINMSNSGINFSSTAKAKLILTSYCTGRSRSFLPVLKSINSFSFSSKRSAKMSLGNNLKPTVKRH